MVVIIEIALRLLRAGNDGLTELKVFPIPLNCFTKTIFQVVFWLVIQQFFALSMEASEWGISPSRFGPCRISTDAISGSKSLKKT